MNENTKLQIKFSKIEKINKQTKSFFLSVNCLCSLIFFSQMDSTASSSTLPLPSSSTSALTPALFKRLHPKAYLEKFLTEGVRPDGRPLGIKSDEIWREASANLGKVIL